MRSSQHNLIRMLVVLGIFCLEPSAHAVESYEQALTRVKGLETAGRSAEAAAALERLLKVYPQDYGVLIYAARLHFELGDFQRAAERYRQAVEISGGSMDSRLGLGWSYLRLGDRTAARKIFKELLRSAPAEHAARASARKGLSLSAPRPLLKFSPSFSATVHGYPGHATKSWGLGGLLSLPVMITEQMLLEVDYRYSNFLGPRGQGGNGNRSSGKIASLFDQHEGYLAGGVVRPRFGVLGHYALLHDGDESETSHVAGLSARYSPWGDLLLELSASFYPELMVLRAAPAWRIRPLPWLSISPALAVQGVLPDADGEASVAHVSGSLGAAVTSARGSLWIGGKVGAESRPVYLSVPTVFNIPEQINFGLWAGASLKIGAGALFIAYELNQLELEGMTSMMHLGTLGLRWSFPSSTNGGTDE